MTGPDAATAVTACGHAARAAAPRLAAAPAVSVVAALRSAVALFDRVIGPALTAAGLDAAALQLVRTADRRAAVELVSRPGLIPLVILRGSGDTTRSLAMPCSAASTASAGAAASRGAAALAD